MESNHKPNAAKSPKWGLGFKFQGECFHQNSMLRGREEGGKPVLFRVGTLRFVAVLSDSLLCVCVKWHHLVFVVFTNARKHCGAPSHRLWCLLMIVSFLAKWSFVYVNCKLLVLGLRVPLPSQGSEPCFTGCAVPQEKMLRLCKRVLWFGVLFHWGFFCSVLVFVLEASSKHFSCLHNRV